MEGTEDAWRADTQKTNRCVQLAVRTPIKHVRRYTFRLPDDAVFYVIQRGNVTNDQVTNVGPLEQMADAIIINHRWGKKKKSLGWTQFYQKLLYCWDH